MSRTELSLRVIRFIAAVYGIVALLWIPMRNIGVDSFSTVNYLSYFTIESNILAVLVLLVGAVCGPGSRIGQSTRWQWVRGGVTTYMVITAIVYQVLLANVDVMLQDEWINIATHRLLPLILLLDWVLCPPQGRIGTIPSLAWMWFPLVYGVYTLLRGPIVDWYPYPFIDPREQGYWAMALSLVLVSVAMAVVAAAVEGIGRVASRRRNAREELVA